MAYLSLIRDLLLHPILSSTYQKWTDSERPGLGDGTPHALQLSRPLPEGLSLYGMSYLKSAAGRRRGKGTWT